MFYMIPMKEKEKKRVYWSSICIPIWWSL